MVTKKLSDRNRTIIFMTVTSQISVLTVKCTGSFLEIQSHVSKRNPIALKILIIQIILSYDKSSPILNKKLKKIEIRKFDCPEVIFELTNLSTKIYKEPIT
jgi:hypothetical protein